MDNEQLIIPSADWGRGTEVNPYQHAPGGQSPPYKFVLLELYTEIIIWSPYYDEVSDYSEKNCARRIAYH